MQEIKCSECNHIFKIEDGVGLVSILCPYCGSEKIAESSYGIREVAAGDKS